MFTTFVAAAGLSGVLVVTVRAIARRRQLFDLPVADRWHEQPIPKFGGIAMAIAFGLVVGMSRGAAELWPILAGASLMFVIGLVDDIKPVRPVTKLIGQMIVAAGMVAFLPTIQLTGSSLVDSAVAFAWIVTITNAFNLIDNIDGLAAGVAAIIAAFLFVLVRSEPAGLTTPVMIGSVALAGVAAGFLLFNAHPATIFMGDAGSHLIGAAIAGLSLLAAPAARAHGVPLPAAGVSLFAVPLFDTLFVAITRHRGGRSPFTGGRDHTSHRLVAMGLDEHRAVLTLYGISAMAGVIALGFDRLPAPTAWMSASLFGAVIMLIGISLARVDVSASVEGSWINARRTRKYQRAVLVYGAGRAGRLTARELRQNSSLQLAPVGFIDDDRSKRRKRIEDLPVLGGLDQLSALLDDRVGAVHAVVIGIGHLPQQALERLREICDARAIPILRMQISLERTHSLSRLRVAN